MCLVWCMNLMNYEVLPGALGFYTEKNKNKNEGLTFPEVECCMAYYMLASLPCEQQMRQPI